MSTDEDRATRAALIDPVRSACLCDVGAPAWLAATVVDPDGNDVLMLADQRHLDLGDPANGYPRGAPPHEVLGVLPIEYHRRIAIAARPRCGRPTAHGTPCKLRVPNPGAACAFHRDDGRAEP